MRSGGERGGPRAPHTPPGGQPQEFAGESPLHYTLANGHVEIAFECRDVLVRALASCVAPPHAAGTVSGQELHLTCFSGGGWRYRLVE